MVEKAQFKEDNRSKDAEATLMKWTEAVATGRVEDVVDLYTKDAILVPTLSNEIVVTEAGRRQYFEFFLADCGPNCAVERMETRMDHNGGTIAIGGIYRFRFNKESGVETVPARFLFTFEEIGGRWLITSHHSSRCI